MVHASGTSDVDVRERTNERATARAREERERERDAATTKPRVEDARATTRSTNGARTRMTDGGVMFRRGRAWNSGRSTRILRRW